MQKSLVLIMLSGTAVLAAKEQICDRKGYTGDTACADCGECDKFSHFLYSISFYKSFYTCVTQINI